MAWKVVTRTSVLLGLRLESGILNSRNLEIKDKTIRPKPQALCFHTFMAMTV